MPPKNQKKWPPKAVLTLTSISGQSVIVSTSGTTAGSTGTGRSRTQSQLASWTLYWGDGTQDSGSGPPPATLTHAYPASQTTAYTKLVVVDVTTLTAQATLTITLLGIVPNAPTGLSATTTGQTTIALAWNTVVGATSYNVEQSDDNVTFSFIAAVLAPTITYNDSGLTADTTYYYRVQAVNASGAGAYSNTASAKTDPASPPPSPPNAPSALSATAISSAQINLAWTDNAGDETGFKIERAPDGVTFTQIATVAANVVSYSDLTVAASSTYTYRVRSYNQNGDSAYSNTSAATTSAPPVPTAPSSLTATTQSQSAIALAWTDNSNNETGFSIEQKIGSGQFATIATVPVGTTTYLVQSLTAATTYSYRVRAFNANGNSSYSNTATATTLTNPTPPPPIGPTCGIGVDAASAAGIPVGTVTTISTSATPGSTPIATWLVTFGDGATQNGSGTPPSTILHTYPVGSFQPSLLVTDGNGLTATDFGGPAIITSVPPIPTVPAAPSNLAGSQTAPTQVRLTWQDNSNNEDGFNIERKITGAASFAVLATTPTAVTNYQDNAVSQGNSYDYRVNAFNAGGNSSYSNVVTVGLPNGADFYVAPGGVDGPSHTGSISDPFATFAYALSRATAALAGSGKVIWGRGATYNQALIEPTAQGTSWINRLRVANYPGETVTLQYTGGTLTSHVVAFTSGQRYLEFDGINVDASASVNEASAMHIEDNANGANHLRWLNAEWIGKIGGGGHGTTDAPIIIACHQTGAGAGGDFLFQSLRLHHAGGVGDFAYAFYASVNNLIIDSCEMYDLSGYGVQLYNGGGFLCTGAIIRNCYIHDIVRSASPTQCAGLIFYGSNIRNVQLYNTVIARIGVSGFSNVAGLIVGSGSNGHTVANNTVYAPLNYAFDLGIGAETGTLNNNIAYLYGSAAITGGSGWSKANNFLSGNPTFVNESTSDFHLRAGSPCIDAGIPMPQFTTDKDGVLRPQLSAWDIGAYEYH